jgi:hypothetical protein
VLLFGRRREVIARDVSPRPAQLSENRVPAAIIRETRRYGRAVHRRVLVGAGGVLVLAIYLWLLQALFATQHPPAGAVDVVVQPLSATTLVAVYAGLGAVALALQFGARTIVAGSNGNVDAMARTVVQRAFVDVLAWLTLLASFSVGAVTVIWFSAFPHVDAARTFGPLAASTFLAYIAAETSAAMENPFATTVRQELSSRRRRLLRHTVETQLPARAPQFRQWLLRLLVVLMLPVACTAAGQWILPAQSAAALLGRFGLGVLAAATVYALTVLMLQALLDRQTGLAVSVTFFAFLAGLEGVFTVLRTPAVAPHASEGEVARTFIVLWVLTVMVPFAVVSVSASQRSGMVIEEVRWILSRRLQRLTAVSEKPSERRPPLGRFVVWAWVFFLVFPLGIVLARRAVIDASAFGYRGVGAAKAAGWACGAVAAAFVIAASVVALLPQKT